MNRVSPLPSTGSKNLNSSQDSADTEDRSYHAGDSGSESFHSCVSQASTQPSLTESEVDALALSPLPDTSCNRGSCESNNSPQALSEISVISGK